MFALYLLAALGDDSFEVRRKAHAALEAPACRSLLPLIALACHSPDPEIANRADQIAGVHRRGVADDFCASVCCWPWIDFIPNIGQEFRPILEKVTYVGFPEHPEPHPRYREAMRRWAWAKIANGEASPEEIRRILTATQQRCDDYLLGKMSHP